MTIIPAQPGDPRRPQGPRDPGDAWVAGPDGTRYWGRFGAAGLLAVDEQRGVLLQQRVEWSHHGGTWGIPGGALHEGESAVHGAVREAREEAGVPDGAVRALFTSVFDVGFWRYTTVVGLVEHAFEPTIADPESDALEWVPPAQVADRPLHPGFAAAWPALAGWMHVRPVVVVDIANVMGSVPDGWWKDRAGSAERWLGKIAALAERGVAAAALEMPAEHWFPDFVAIVEGQAKHVTGPAGVTVVGAPASGDDKIVEQVRRLRGRRITVVTNDRELIQRVTAEGAATKGAGWLRSLLQQD